MRLPSSQLQRTTRNKVFVAILRFILKCNSNRNILAFSLAGSGERRSLPFKLQTSRLEPISSLEQPTHSHSQSFSQSAKLTCSTITHSHRHHSRSRVRNRDSNIYMYRNVQSTSNSNSIYNRNGKNHNI